jgi:hypothetical protein
MSVGAFKRSITRLPTQKKDSRRIAARLSRQQKQRHQTLCLTDWERWATHFEGVLTREEALELVLRKLHTSLADAVAHRLIHVFHIQAEELTEGGLDFESVRALANRYVLN